MAKKKNEPDKLAQEVSQAIAEGMSYGKWKAMQPRAEIPKKPPVVDFVPMRCAFCGCEFVDGWNKQRKYCGDRCKAKAAALRAMERNAET